MMEQTQVEWVSRRTEPLPDITDDLVRDYGDRWVAILSGYTGVRWYHQFGGLRCLQAVITGDGQQIVRGTELVRVCKSMFTGGINPLSREELERIDALLPGGWSVDYSKPSYEALVYVKHDDWKDGVLIWENSD